MRLGNNARPKEFGFDNHVRPTRLGCRTLALGPDNHVRLRSLGLAIIPDLGAWAW